MKRLTNMAHSLFCLKSHLQTMEDLVAQKNNHEVCLFYLEQVYDNAWEHRDHVIWTRNAERLLLDLNVDNPAEAYLLLSRALNITKSIAPLVSEHPALRKLFISLLEAI